MSSVPTYLDFLKYCLGNKPDFRNDVEKINWKGLYEFASKQALVGFCFKGIERIGHEYKEELNRNPIPEALLLQWMGTAQKIRQQNVRLFMDSANISERFRQAGFYNCILKGQGNALLYPDPYSRTPGDIDIYLEGGRKRIMQYVDTVCPNQVMRYHHIDFPVIKTPVEVHFTPSFMSNPFYNQRMQKWFRLEMHKQCINEVVLPDTYGKISVPTASFNAIYILSHLFRHVFTEGIGLRQLLDYYYVLITVNSIRKDCSNKGNCIDANSTINNPSANTSSSANNELAMIQQTIKHFGLCKFAGAIMYVLYESFGLSEDKMIAPKNEKEGKFLMEEVIRGGNFGKYDDRLGSKESENKVHRYLRMSLRNLRFIKHYPTEALCEPLFRTSFAIWKFAKGSK